LFDQVHRASIRGHGAVLLIGGPVGTGKTALLQAMAARAGQQGGWSFVVTGSARERGHPFGVLDRLIQSMCVAGMADPFPSGMDGGEDFFVMMDRVRAAVREFIGGRPILVGIDDVHFADEQSLRSLSYLIRRIESSTVVVVLNESTSYEREMADFRAETLHLPFCHQVRLTPLKAADVAEQLRERFCGAPDRALVQLCAEVSGGVPLLLHALFDDLAAAPAPARGEPGTNFRQAVLRSLHRCAFATAAVAQAIAVLGDYAAPELIAELSGVDVALVEESVRDLREMGLLGHEWFRHPAARSAVLAGMALADLSRMQSRAAELLHESGAPAIAVAERLIAAQDGGKAPWRVAILCEAAREAMAAGDIDNAVSSMRHAIAASPDEEERARTGVLLAEAQWYADPSRAARRLGELGQDARAGLLTGPDILIAVNQLLWWGEFAEADELLRLADETAEADGLTELWTFFCRVRWGRGGCAEPSGWPADSPLAQSGPMAAAIYLSSAAILALQGGKADQADETLLGLVPGTSLTPPLLALVVLVQTGRSGEAVAWCERLLKEEWIHRVPMRRVMIGTIESVALMSSGESAAALRCIREVFEAVPPPAWGVVVGLPLSVAIRASIDLGDTHAARSYLAVPVPAAMLDTPFALPYLLALGWYHVAMGHPESAQTHTRLCLELTTKWGIDAAGLEVSPPAPLEDVAEAGPRCPFEFGGQPEDGANLTDAEQRVASLAAAGNTNRQIAERLFITVSTVEQHLTKIYRKLNVRSRSGLQRYSDSPPQR
jgi:DNA-binding CsgD family transcriptional regulator/tetratricopeptide (TPR) repeat protein